MKVPMKGPEQQEGLVLVQVPLSAKDQNPTPGDPNIRHARHGASREWSHLVPRHLSLSFLCDDPAAADDDDL